MPELHLPVMARIRGREAGRVNGIATTAAALALLVTVAMPRAYNASDDAVVALARFLAGTFDTTEQAAADQRIGAAYVHDRVRLQVSPPLTLGAAAGDGTYMYVEQAQLTSLARPYRQRVYRLIPQEHTVLLEVWKITDAVRFVGGIDDPAKLAALRYEDLHHEAGCDVPLAREGDRFRGAIPAKTCASAWNGSAYVISEMTIFADGQDVLDRGFDGEGRQTFGPRNGEAYQFRRVAR